jgi:PTS system ascorbate-specific IIA component
MSIALFFVTHQGIASSLLGIGEAIIKKPNSNLAFVDVPMDADTNSIIDVTENKLKNLDLTDGILFITDIYGGTPSNIAQQLASNYDASLISGVNLPMIIRLLNYRKETEQVLVQKALDGAHKGIQVHNNG